jgi:hypothetical protein
MQQINTNHSSILPYLPTIHIISTTLRGKKFCSFIFSSLQLFFTASSLPVIQAGNAPKIKQPLKTPTLRRKNTQATIRDLIKDAG